MFKIAYILCLVLATSTLALGGDQDTVYHFFKGAVNKEYSITVELKIAGNVCVGHYYYDKYRKKVKIEGELRADNQLMLREFDQSGNRTSSVFTGMYSSDWKIVQGTWENTTKDRRFDFDLKAIEYPLGQQITYNFDDIRRFQELLNYFDMEPQLPFRVHKGLEKKGFRWRKGLKESARKDYQRMIPYRLARRYVMDKVLLKGEGAFNYFNIKEANYKAHEMHYKSLCCVYRTASYVGLLFHFADDTGWDVYDVTFLVMYDYAGNVLDACKLGRDVNVEHAGVQLTEKTSSQFRLDSTIETISNQFLIEFGTEANEEYYRENNNPQHIYYTVQPSGRLMRQQKGNPTKTNKASRTNKAKLNTRKK